MILWLPLSVPAHKSFYIYIRCLNGVGQTRLFGIDSLSAQIILHLLYIRCWTKSYFHLFGIDLLHTALDWLHRWLQRRLYFNKLVELTTVYQVLLPRQLHPFHQVRNGSSTSCFSKAVDNSPLLISLSLTKFSLLTISHLALLHRLNQLNHHLYNRVRTETPQPQARHRQRPARPP